MARHETPDFRDRLEYAALSGLLATLRMPSRRSGRAWGRGLGRFVERCVPVRRDVALANLRASFPEKSEEEILGIYRGMLGNVGMVLAEFARYGKRDVEPITDAIRVANPEAFAPALVAGKGALMLTGHFGNWEALGVAVRASGYPLTVLEGRQRNPLVEALITRYRERMALKMLTVGKSLRPIVQALRRGGFVASLADQDGGPDGFFIDFLGRPASVQPGLFRLAARLQVPMLLAFSIREGDGWRAQLHEPMMPRPVEGEKEGEAEARRLAALYTATLEDYVRRYPDHWFWVHRRWRSRPPEEA